MGLPQIGYASKLTVAGAGVQVERSMDDVIETLEAPLPAAITVVSEINEPRIPSLMNIMKAGKKPVTEWTLADLGLDAAAVAAQRDHPLQPGRRAGPQDASCSRATRPTRPKP